MDISNRTLAVLLVAAIVVSLGGTMLSIDKIAKTEYMMDPITGMVTQGTVAVRMDAVTQINFTDATINFGTFSEIAATGCYPDTLLGTNVGCTDGTTQSDGLTIENIGNTNISVNLSSSHTGATLIGGTGPAIAFQTANVSGEGTACVTLGNGLNYTETWTNITTAGLEFDLCRKLKFADAADSFDVEFRLRLPQDMTFTGAVQTATISGEAIAIAF